MKNCIRILMVSIMLLGLSISMFAQPLAPVDVVLDYDAVQNTAALNWKVKGLFTLKANAFVRANIQSPTMEEIFNSWVRVGTGDWTYTAGVDQLVQNINAVNFTYYYEPSQANARNFEYTQYMMTYPSGYDPGTGLGGDDDFIGVIFRVQDASHYYVFMWGRQDSSNAYSGRRLMIINGHTFDEFVHGTHFPWFIDPSTIPTDMNIVDLWHEDVGYQVDTWYKVRLVAVGNNFKLYIATEPDFNDETLIFDYTDAADTFPSGSFGLWTWSMDHVFYKNVAYEILSVEAPDIASTGEVYTMSQGVGKDVFTQVLESPIGDYLEPQIAQWAIDNNFDRANVDITYDVLLKDKDISCYELFISSDGYVQDKSDPTSLVYAKYIPDSMFFTVNRSKTGAEEVPNIRDLFYNDEQIPNCNPPDQDIEYLIEANYSGETLKSPASDIVADVTENSLPAIQDLPTEYTIIGGFVSTIDIAGYIHDENPVDDPETDSPVISVVAETEAGNSDLPGFSFDALNYLDDKGSFEVVNNTSLKLYYPREYTTLFPGQEVDRIQITVTDCSGGVDTLDIFVTIQSATPMVYTSSSHLAELPLIEDDQSELPIFYFTVVSGEAADFEMHQVTFKADPEMEGNPASLGKLKMYEDANKNGVLDSGENALTNAQFQEGSDTVTFDFTGFAQKPTIPNSSGAIQSKEYIVSIETLSVNDILLAYNDAPAPTNSYFEDPFSNIQLAWMFPLLAILLLIGIFALRSRRMGLSTLSFFFVAAVFIIHVTGCFQGEGIIVDDTQIITTAVSSLGTEWSAVITNTDIVVDTSDEITPSTTSFTKPSDPPPPPETRIRKFRLIMQSCEDIGGVVCDFKGKPKGAAPTEEYWNNLPENNLYGTKIVIKNQVFVDSAQ